METKQLDAHHIISRDEFEDGGYFLENGVTLCPGHHIMAENNLITTQEIYNVLEYDEEVIGSVLWERRGGSRIR